MTRTLVGESLKGIRLFGLLGSMIDSRFWELLTWDNSPQEVNTTNGIVTSAARQRLTGQMIVEEWEGWQKKEPDDPIRKTNELVGKQTIGDYVDTAAKGDTWKD